MGPQDKGVVIICRGGWFLDGATGPAPPLEPFAPYKHVAHWASTSVREVVFEIFTFYQ